MYFDWHVYLSETGAEVSPPSLFDHVRRSLETLLHKGQIMEAKFDFHFNENAVTADYWWPAEVVLVSGYMVLLKWCIPETQCTILSKENALTFWFDVKGASWNSLRPVSSDYDHIASWSPPLQLSEDMSTTKHSDMKSWAEKLIKRPVPNVFFDQHILYAFETIRVGGYFECEHVDDPNCVWPVKVLSNVGGRVRLAWFGVDPIQTVVTAHSNQPTTFTLFYLHRRMHPLGWGKRCGLYYRSPPGLKVDRAISNMDTFLRGALAACEDMGVGCNTSDGHIRTGHPVFNRDPVPHEFKVGWKIEAVNPEKPYLLQPATIAKVYNTRYIMVELDDISCLSSTCQTPNNSAPQHPKVSFVSYAGAAEIMPVNTSQLRGIHLEAPFGWPNKRPFSWTLYLTDLSTLQSAKDSPSSKELQYVTTNGDRLSSDAPLVDDCGTDTAPTNGSTLNAVDASGHLIIMNTQLPYCPPESTFRGCIPIVFPVNDVGNLDSNCNFSSDVRPATSNSLPTSSLSQHTPSRFLLGMKLEMVVPVHVWKSVLQFKPESNLTELPLCTATVTRVEGTHLLWLMHDITSFTNGLVDQPVMMDARSSDLYPVGWASSVGLSLIAPTGYEHCCVNQEKVTEEKTTSVANDNEMSPLRPLHDMQYNPIQCEEEEVCPLIHINTKCYLGPFICKANLDLVPRTIGPGPITRVLHSLLSRLAGAAYKPIRVLRMLEADWASAMATAAADLRIANRLHNASTSADKNAHPVVGAPRRRYNLPTAKAAMDLAEKELHEQRRCAMRVVLLRVRCPRRGIKIEAPVEVCCRVRALHEFCRQISLLLEACPHLISLSNPAASEMKTDAVNQMDPPSCPAAMPHTTSSVDCLSFCTSRLRSRNLDRLPGWKRRLFASLRPFGVRLPSNNTTNYSTCPPFPATKSDLRTRSAVAAAQSHYLSRRDSNLASGPLSNGFSSVTNTKRSSARFVGRLHRSGTRSNSIEASSNKTGPGVRLARRRREMPNSELKTASNSAYELGRTPSSFTQYGDASVAGSPRHRPLRVGHPYYHPNPYYHSNHFPHSYRPIQTTWPDPGLIPSTATTLATCHTYPRFNANNRIYFRTPTPTSIMPTPECCPQEAALNSLLSDAPHVTLATNPMCWSPVDLATYLIGTDCQEMWPWLAAEAVDGQAFMLLTWPILHQMMRCEDAVRLARHVVSVKRAFVEQFTATNSEETNSSITAASS